MLSPYLRPRSRSPRIAAAAALLALTLAATPARAAQATCAHASASPRSASVAQTRAATLCLLNAERARHGLPNLRDNRRLRRAAQRHAGDMARRHYFAHDTPSGRSVVDRVRAAGYLRGVHAWTVGENLAWGSGRLATPRQIVAMWMHSPGHRANILSRSFREIGIGVSTGVPVSGDAAARGGTYATDFGSRG
jgi:uncharacterized protein YkwD